MYLLTCSKTVQFKCSWEKNASSIKHTCITFNLLNHYVAADVFIEALDFIQYSTFNWPPLKLYRSQQSFMLPKWMIIYQSLIAVYQFTVPLSIIRLTKGDTQHINVIWSSAQLIMVVVQISFCFIIYTSSAWKTSNVLLQL